MNYDPLNPLSPATRGINHRDNVEQVIIDNPIPGTYTVVISHKGTLKKWQADPENEGSFDLIPGAEQAFSLVISGKQNPKLSPPYLTNLPPIPHSSPGLDWITLEITGFTGLLYQVEVSQTLEPDDWQALVTFPGQTLEVLLPSNAPHPLTFLQSTTPYRFYRVREIVPPTE